MSDKPSADALVTDHAALRWLERVLEVDVGPQSISRTQDTAFLLAACAKLGTTPSVVKTGIATANVRSALDAGAEGIMIPGGVWITFQYGRVATVMTAAMRAGKLPRKAKNPRRRRAQSAAYRAQQSP